MTANVWSDDCEFESDEPWAAARATRLPSGERIGATVYELPHGRDRGWDFRTLDEPSADEG